MTGKNITFGAVAIIALLGAVFYFSAPQNPPYAPEGVPVKGKLEIREEDSGKHFSYPLASR